MKRRLKGIGITLGALLGVIIVAVAVLHFVGSNRLAKAPAVAVRAVDVSSVDAFDAESIARGAHLASISSCKECHGPDLGGTVFIDEAPIGYIPAANLTGGAGGVGGAYKAADWAGAIRHGVAADGRPLGIMPSYHFDAYSDEDLAKLIAYLQSVPPVDNDLGRRAITFPGTIIFGMLAFDDITSVNRIDHESMGKAAPQIAPSAEYGAYLVEIAACGSCHGENLAGAESADGPQGPNITRGGDLATWSQDDFATAVRTGITPGGRPLSTEMPWRSYAEMTDDEIAALWAHLQSMPALETHVQ